MDNSAWGGALSRFPDFDDDFAKGAAEFLKEPYEEWFSQKHPLSSPKTIGWINGHRPARCPHCGAASPVGFGLTSVGIRRYICRSCGSVSGLLKLTKTGERNVTEIGENSSTM
jgi:hypothetical protein